METETLITIGSIAVLIVLSGIFSGSETAFTAASQPRMHLLSKQGHHRADIVTRLHGQKERMIGAILLGNNLVNILASALATGLMISSFGESGVVYATIIMTVLVLIFGEVMPKTYALHHADKVALAIAPALRVLVAFLSPITHSLNFLILRVMKLFRIQFDTGLEWGASEEALRGAIELHRGAEPTVREERIMLRSILDLADVDVGEIMQHRQDVIAVDADLPPHQIIEQIIDCPYTRIPMWRDQPENIVGVLHSKELLRQVHENRDNLDKIDMNSISTPPWFIPESTSLLDQLSMFRRRHEHFAMVVDEYGSIMGVVTLEDILEEIVGDIVDEHDIVPVGVRPQSDGTFLIDGRVTIRDLNRRFDWSLPDDAASTLAGLVIEIARIIPEKGQIFTFKGFRFEVASRRRNRLASIKVTPPAV